MSFEAERSSRSAWNARAAVVRCSGAKVLRTPSHVKASFTAAMVVRSLWTELGEVWLTGVLLGWVVVRLVVCGLVVGSVVVAVDMRISCVGSGSPRSAMEFGLQHRQLDTRSAAGILFCGRESLLRIKTGDTVGRAMTE